MKTELNIIDLQHKICIKKLHELRCYIEKTGHDMILNQDLLNNSVNYIKN